MNVKLCYKTYEVKLTLKAMEQFKQAVNKDLWHTLLSLIESYQESDGRPVIVRMRKLYEALDFFEAAELFHAMIRACDQSIPLDEVKDSMLRVGWLPSEREDDMSEPWPLVMVKLAYDVDKYFKDDLLAKKAGAATSQSDGKS